MSAFEDLERAKIEARKRLNALPPKQAQEIVNRVLRADELRPDITGEVDWDEIPIPNSWLQNDE